MILKNKKGQITIFIIIAVVLLFSAALIFYVRARVSDIPQRELEITLEEVPVELQPLQGFVTNCVEDSAVKGLEIIGRQGGYIDVSQFRTNKQDPTESDALYLDSSTSSPYWFYLKSDNDCSFNCEFLEKVPSLDQIRVELEEYIAVEVRKCVGNFESFEEQGFDIKQLGNPKADVYFAKYDTNVVVNYPLEVRKAGRKEKMTKFYVKLPVAFNKIYNLAAQVEKIQADDSDLMITGRFLEKQALALIVGFSDVSSEKLIPWSAFKSTLGSRVYWVKSQVKDEVENMLMYYTPFLRIDGTKYKPIQVGNSFSQGFYEQTFRLMDFKLEETEYNNENLDVSFKFRKDPTVVKNTYLDIDCGGELCKPDVINVPILSWLGMGIQSYEFHYDLSYPVVVEIFDPTAFNKRGYTFAFALEANIRGNEVMDGTYIDSSALSLASEVSPCDLDQRNSGDITIVVRDGETDKIIEDAIITYGVGNIACEVLEV